MEREGVPLAGGEGEGDMGWEVVPLAGGVGEDDVGWEVLPLVGGGWRLGE